MTILNSIMFALSILIDLDSLQDCRVGHVRIVVERKDWHEMREHFKGNGKAYRERFRYQPTSSDVCLVFQ